MAYTQDPNIRELEQDYDHSLNVDNTVMNVHQDFNVHSDEQVHSMAIALRDFLPQLNAGATSIFIVRDTLNAMGSGGLTFMIYFCQEFWQSTVRTTTCVGGELIVNEMSMPVTAGPANASVQQTQTIIPTTDAAVNAHQASDAHPVSEVQPANFVHPARNPAFHVSQARAATIPRPANAFILFRREMQRELKKVQPGITNSDVSKMVGRAWGAAKEDVKDFWREKSEEGKRQHQILYPNYIYQPLKNHRSTRVQRASPKKQKGSTMPIWQQDKLMECALQNTNAQSHGSVQTNDTGSSTPEGTGNTELGTLDGGVGVVSDEHATTGVADAGTFGDFFGEPETDMMDLPSSVYQENAMDLGEQNVFGLFGNFDANN